MRTVIDEARDRLRRTGEQTVLFIDEVHRFSKTQQDSLLGAVEDRTVILIAATTENPFFSVVSPLLSRSLVLQLQPLADVEVGELLDRAVADERGLRRRRVGSSDEARAHLVAVGRRRRSAGADRARGGSGRRAGARGRRTPAAVDRPRSSGRSWIWRPSNARSTGPRFATTARAISTTTSSARSSSRSGAATSTPPCTTWPG